MITDASGTKENQSGADTPGEKKGVSDAAISVSLIILRSCYDELMYRLEM